MCELWARLLIKENMLESFGLFIYFIPLRWSNWNLAFLLKIRGIMTSGSDYWEFNFSGSPNFVILSVNRYWYPPKKIFSPFKHFITCVQTICFRIENLDLISTKPAEILFIFNNCVILQLFWLFLTQIWPFLRLLPTSIQ